MRQETKIINGYYLKDEKARNDINIINTDNPYYDEITYEKERYYDTDCYITTIPKFDNNNELIKLYVADNTGISPTKYARDEYTTLTINASSYITDMVDSSLSGVPIMIGNGEILRNHPMISEGVADNILYLGITPNREIREYQVNNTLAQTMLNDGCEQVFDVYYKLIENNSALDLSGVLVKGSNTIVTEKHPRQCIGIKSDGTIIILSCDGRTADNMGLTSEETQEILLAKNCVNAWNIDGGGSTSTTIKGTKINRNVDDDGTTDRIIPFTLNIKKENDLNEIITKAFSKIGEVKQEILNQILPDVFNMKGDNITSQDVDDLIGRVYMGYGNNLTNIPVSTSGYFINIPHSGSSGEEYRELYNVQLYFTRDTNNCYIRRQVNGNFTPWIKLNGEFVNAYNSGGNIVMSSTDYETLPFKFSESNLVIQGVEETKDQSNRYTEFKFNTVGKFLIHGYINLVPKTADGDRYIQLTKNGNSNDNLRIYEVVDQADIIYFESYINNDDTDNVFSFTFKGQNNDAITRLRIAIESK